MSHADVLEDSYPHGTPEGYDGFGEGGCRGGACPAGLEHGLSCKIAKQKSRGDYQYQKLAKSGATPAEIAAALGFVGELPAGTPKPKSKPAPKAQPAPVPTPKPAADVPGLAAGGVTEGSVRAIIGDNPDVPEAVQPLSPVLSNGEQAEQPPAEPVATSAAADAAAGPTTREIREWARSRGYEIGAKGAIPKHIRAHYDQVHEPKTEIEFTTAEQIRAFVGPLRRDDGTINASAVAQEANLRERAGLPSWIAALDAPPVEPDTDATERDTSLDQAATAEAHPVVAAVEHIVNGFANVGSLIVDGFMVGDAASAPALGPARPEWGYVALREDLATATAERDRARDLAARLEAELHRMEATLTEHRERASNALADYLRDLGQLERDRDAATTALEATASALRSTETALEFVVQKWGELKADQAPRLLFTTVQPNQHTEVTITMTARGDDR